jgi:hypothetical protein
MDHKKLQMEDAGWIRVAQDRVPIKVPVNTAMTFESLKRQKNPLINWVDISFSMMTHNRVKSDAEINIPLGTETGLFGIITCNVSFLTFYY